MRLALAITHKGHRRIERVVVGDQPFRIGRAWDSDLLLDDKYINEEHLEIGNQNGEIWIRDLHSRNGTLLEGKLISSAPRPLQFGQSIVLGDTQIQVFDVQSRVAPASLRSGWFLLVERFGSLSALLLLTTLALTLEVLAEWLRTTQRYGFGDAVVALATMLVGLAGIVLALALLSKLLRNEMNFKAHWLIVVIASIAYSVTGFVLQILRFNLQRPVVSDAVIMLVVSALAMFWLVGFLSYATNLNPAKRAAWAFAVVALFLAFNYSEDWLEEEHERWHSYSTSENLTLQPLFLFRSTIGVEEYFSETSKLFEFSQDELASSNP